MLYRGFSNACFSMLYRIDITPEFCILWDTLWVYCGGILWRHPVEAFIISLNVHTSDAIICCIAGFQCLF